MSGFEVEVVGENNTKEVFDFLHKRKEFCIFMIDNLKNFGPKPVENQIYSGTFFAIRRTSGNKGICCVFYKTGAKTVLIQGDGKYDYSDLIMESLDCKDIIGVLGDSDVTKSLKTKFVEKKIWKSCSSGMNHLESLLELPLQNYEMKESDENSRIARIEDFDEYYENSKMYGQELEIPDGRGREIQKKRFEDGCKNKTIYVTFTQKEGKKKLVSQSVITSRSMNIGVIGGVFTRKEFRRKGYSTKNLKCLINGAKEELKLEKLVLFTDIDGGAEKLYMKLGFKKIGFFGLFFKD